MKSILLASASVIAFAGMASAEVTFSGEFEMGYNTDDNPGFVGDDNEGFYADLDITIGLEQTLDNGLTVGASVDLEDLADGNDDFADYEFYLKSDTAGLYFGDTEFAAITHWQSAGDMEQDSFSEVDGESVLRGDVMFNNISASVSYLIADTDGLTVTDATGGTDSVDQLSIGAVGTFGNFTVGMGYQDESVAPGWGVMNGDFDYNQIYGVFVSTTFGAADITLAYASDETDNEDSLGLKVAYPIGPVTVTGYYVEESNGDPNYGLNVAYENGPFAVALDYQDDQGVEKIGVEGSYDVGNGIMVYAGYLTEDSTEDRYYVAGEYDLGSGASVLFSYAQDDDNVDEDEIGGPEYQRGTTLELNFEF